MHPTQSYIYKVCDRLLSKAPSHLKELDATMWHYNTLERKILQFYPHTENTWDEPFRMFRAYQVPRADSLIRMSKDDLLATITNSYGRIRYYIDLVYNHEMSESEYMAGEEDNRTVHRMRRELDQFKGAYARGALVYFVTLVTAFYLLAAVHNCQEPELTKLLRVYVLLGHL